MKVCGKCGVEIDGKDGENLCLKCEEHTAISKRQSRAARRRQKEQDQILRDLGLVKVRGALGGTYWE